jgi:hypothetical protein
MPDGLGARELRARLPFRLRSTVRLARIAPEAQHAATAPETRPMNDSSRKWKFDGVRVVHGHELDVNTPQTPGMNRAAAITNARTGAEKLWAGTVVIHPKAKTGAHHHGRSRA